MKKLLFFVTMLMCLNLSAQIDTLTIDLSPQCKNGQLTQVYLDLYEPDGTLIETNTLSYSTPANATLLTPSAPVTSSNITWDGVFTKSSLNLSYFTDNLQVETNGEGRIVTTQFRYNCNGFSKLSDMMSV